MVDPIAGTKRLTKVLMYGGSYLNILYAITLDKMGIPRSSLCPSKVLFYGIMSGKEAVPLGLIWLILTFGQLDNFRKEPLIFEAIKFPGAYHALLDRPCFTKFMAVPNYTYLKLKMPYPRGSSPLRVASSKPTNARKIASPKRPCSSPPVLPMALTTM